MKISVTISGVDLVRRRLSGLAKQVPFALSLALNRTAQSVADAMPAAMRAALDRPTPFTQRSVRVLSKASKHHLLAVVGVQPVQAKYLRWAVTGGVKTPGVAGLRLPSAITLNEFGNIPRGAIARLIAIARKERKSAKVAGKRIRISDGVEIFYGDPIDQAGKKFPRGIYKDVRRRDGRNMLIPLIVFPQSNAIYRRRFDFHRLATATVRREWHAEFSTALQRAVDSAK